MAVVGAGAAAAAREALARHLPVPIFKLLAEREEGNLRCLPLERAVKRMRSEIMGLSKDRTVESYSGSSVSCMVVDETEDRYLLCGYKDGSISVVDVEDNPTRSRQTFEEALRVERGKAHKYSVTGCAWYPVDTGMFVTAGFDAKVKVWDTNTSKTVHTFSMPGKVHCMSICPSVRHSLVVAGCEDGLAYLCDLQTGSRSQMLRGHKDAVSAAAWRPGADFHLVTGGVDGTLRLWDVRRTRNCLALLSQEGNPTVASRQVDMLSPPVAHSGGVDSLLYSHDGCNLLSSGADCRMRLWDPDTCELVVANYGTFPHRRGGSHRRVQPAVSRNANIVYHPRANDVVGCNIETGKRVSYMRAHLDNVTCIAVQAGSEQVFSAGLDCNLLVWAPPRGLYEEVVDDVEDAGADAWSDDDV